MDGKDFQDGRQLPSKGPNVSAPGHASDEEWENIVPETTPQNKYCEVSLNERSKSKEGTLLTANKYNNDYFENRYCQIVANIDECLANIKEAMENTILPSIRQGNVIEDKDLIRSSLLELVFGPSAILMKAANEISGRIKEIVTEIVNEAKQRHVEAQLKEAMECIVTSPIKVEGTSLITETKDMYDNNPILKLISNASVKLLQETSQNCANSVLKGMDKYTEQPSTENEYTVDFIDKKYRGIISKFEETIANIKEAMEYIILPSARQDYIMEDKGMIRSFLLKLEFGPSAESLVHAAKEISGRITEIETEITNEVKQRQVEEMLKEAMECIVTSSIKD